MDLLEDYFLHSVYLYVSRLSSYDILAILGRTIGILQAFSKHKDRTDLGRTLAYIQEKWCTMTIYPLLLELKRVVPFTRKSFFRSSCLTRYVLTKVWS